VLLPVIGLSFDRASVSAPISTNPSELFDFL
jgi:hypothetical protein